MPSARLPSNRTATLRIDQFVANEATLMAVIHAATGSSGNAYPEVILKRSADARYNAAVKVDKLRSRFPSQPLTWRRQSARDLQATSEFTNS